MHSFITELLRGPKKELNRLLRFRILLRKDTFQTVLRTIPLQPVHVCWWNISFHDYLEILWQMRSFSIVPVEILKFRIDQYENRRF